MSTLQVDIVSAEEQLYAGEAKMVIAPAIEGDVGIAPRHAPLLTRLRPGELRIIREGEEEFFFYASGGLLEVQPHRVTVLADTAVRARDIDEAAALEAKRRAEEQLRTQKDEVDYSQVQAELAEAMAQLRALESLRKRAKR
ncbi:F0F1 ATP synthase subunit epsilon [Halorhodospira abdelmalekii]|uniref:F0F1 ATP synthase subunit epsilon n=1 Tax=Halorhodospira abdelmalekii TaxID=421629 RepID=UPI0019067670|nr:F0F1 ATP synthase subunit epsilon [Halorhodospira abdelmalekii]MBK1734224.1 F0F1 ATP synthase subunit epsilon [Halorhodospira abdelmalekii]